MIIDGESSGINVASSTVTFLGDKNILAANFPNTHNTDSSLNDIGGVMRASQLTFAMNNSSMRQSSILNYHNQGH